MSNMLILLFLFSMGSMVGWVIELFFRRYFSPSGRTNKKWVNPGFLIGPYLPLYGTGLCVLYLLAHIKIPGLENSTLEKIVLFLCMAISMTIIEYITGIIFIKGMHVKLWDYTDEWGNIQGIICPRFSLYWALLSEVYYLLIHPFILDALKWLSENLAFSFFIGFFYGLFLIDFAVSTNIMVKIKKFTDDNKIIVKYENLRMKIRLEKERRKEKVSFFLSLYTDVPLREFFEDAIDNMKEKSDEMKENFKDRLDDRRDEMRERYDERKERSEERRKKFEQILEEIGTTRK